MQLFALFCCDPVSIVLLVIHLSTDSLRRHAATAAGPALGRRIPVPTSPGIASSTRRKASDRSETEPGKRSSDNVCDQCRQSAGMKRRFAKQRRNYIAAFSVGRRQCRCRPIYTDDAEYIDPQGNAYQGRQAIEDLLATFFKSYPERKLDLLIDSIRIVSPTVAIEDGVSIVATSKDTPPQSFSGNKHRGSRENRSDGHWLQQ